MEKPKNVSFTWDPDGTCIFGSLYNPQSKCIFDYGSIHHFYFGGLIYLILHHYLNINNMNDAMKLFIFVTILHIIEEYFGNTSKISTEGIVIDYIGPILDPKINPEKRGIDNDYLQNSIGDVVAGVISCILIILYWNYYGKLPYFYWYGFIPIFLLLMDKAKILYK